MSEIISAYFPFILDNLPFMGWGYGQTIGEMYYASSEGFGTRLLLILAVMALVILITKFMVPWLMALCIKGWLLTITKLVINGMFNYIGNYLCRMIASVGSLSRNT